MEWSEVVPLLRGVAHLATTTADGDPHVSAVMPIVDGDELVVFTRADSAKAQRIAANGRVALMWEPGEEVYVHGTATVVDDLDEKRAMWTRPDLPFDPAAFFGDADNPGLVLLRIRPTRAVVMRDDGSGPRAHRWQR